MRGGHYQDGQLVTMLLGHLMTLGHRHLDSYGGAVAVGDLQWDISQTGIVYLYLLVFILSLLFKVNTY